MVVAHDQYALRAVASEHQAKELVKAGEWPRAAGQLTDAAWLFDQAGLGSTARDLRGMANTLRYWHFAQAGADQ